MRPRSRIICFAKCLSMVFFLGLTGCSGLEQSEQEKIRAQNAKGEFVFRHANERQFAYAPPQIRERQKYPWEGSYSGQLPKISTRILPLQGKQLQPASFSRGGQKGEYDYDCGGGGKQPSSLQDKEFIYPILIETQLRADKRQTKKVVITCGHRCPVHNKYADPMPAGQTSKHMIGAEVDFYVQGMEERPEEVVALVQNYYKETALYRGKQEYQQFERYDKSDAKTASTPWYNKEVTIQLYAKGEVETLITAIPIPTSLSRCATTVRSMKKLSTPGLKPSRAINVTKILTIFY